ncbi:MAG: fumarylacetoacetate hydrolase family protein [Rhodospirillales bacterium]|nr:fumarylacetoacetate hydrolase family protein [Rhodospirillales bacterium]
MDHASIEQAAAALVAARRDMTTLPALPNGTSPASAAEAHAIQDATTRLLGATVAAYKTMTRGSQPTERGLIYAGTVHATPASVPAKTVPQCGVEGEVAFVLRRPLPARATPYTREEVAGAVEPLAAIELVHSRFAPDAPVGALDKLADCVSNAGLVTAPPLADWHALQLGALHVTLTVNGRTILPRAGGHVTGDPLDVAVAFVNLMRESDGLPEGAVVTCGTFTGLEFLKPNDTCTVRFDGLGEATVTFTA